MRQREKDALIRRAERIIDESPTGHVWKQLVGAAMFDGDTERASNWIMYGTASQVARRHRDGAYGPYEADEADEIHDVLMLRMLALIG